MQHKCAEFFENDELTIDIRGVREVLVNIVVSHQRCSNQRSYRTLRNLGVYHYKLEKHPYDISVLYVQINRTNE